METTPPPTSPVLWLTEYVVDAPRKVAPEREAELRALQDRLQIRVVVDGDRRDHRLDFASNANKPEMYFGIGTLERLWAHAYAHLVLAQLIQRRLGQAFVLDPSSDADLRTALALLRWGESRDLTPWPPDLPAPTRTMLIGEQAATELFLCAAGWILLHELGHIDLGHAGWVPDNESQQQEFAADTWASRWMFGRWRDYSVDPRVLGKRGIGAVLGLTAVGRWESSLSLSSDSRRTHPKPAERLVRFLDEFVRPERQAAPPEVSHIEGVAASVLAIHVQDCGQEMPTGPFETVAELLDILVMLAARL